MLMTSAPRRFPASSKDVRVRVEVSIAGVELILDRAEAILQRVGDQRIVQPLDRVGQHRADRTGARLD